VTHRTDDESPTAGAKRASSDRGVAVRRLRALSDLALIDAMRRGEELAWGEFVDRFRPLLEQFAERTGIPRHDWPACIVEVLDDVALGLVGGRLAVPGSLGAYLVRAVRNRYLRVRRAAERRERRYALAGEGSEVVASLCSESTVRASCGPVDDSADVPAVLGRLAASLRKELSEDELLLLTWRSAAVPYRQIAEWLGVTYDAAAKRVARLSRRARALAQLHAERLPPDERAELGRFFRRIGVTTDEDMIRRGADR
jgi:DNA-directed RNA polymerase specialized sigma24 family protein